MCEFVRERGLGGCVCVLVCHNMQRITMEKFVLCRNVNVTKCTCGVCVCVGVRVCVCVCACVVRNSSV